MRAQTGRPSKNADHTHASFIATMINHTGITPILQQADKTLHKHRRSIFIYLCVVHFKSSILQV
jgi:hypothetical protein